MIWARAENSDCAVSISGDIATITTEAQGLLMAVYDGLLESNAEAAAAFKRTMTECIMEDMVFVSKDERERKLREATDRKRAELKALMLEMLDEWKGR